MDYDLIVIAGEPSGDHHAAEVLKNLKASNPHLKIAAVAGPKMRSAYPLTEILGIEQLSIMGFVDVLINLPKLYFAYRKILKFILTNTSKMVLFVDYPGMNLKLGKTLREKGYQGKICQFIAPTAWAWKKNRVHTLKKYCDKLFCILPFEEAFFKSYGIDAKYVGNPLVQKLKPYIGNNSRNQGLVAIFPGSRKHEIHKNLSLILEACHTIQKKHTHIKFGLSIARPELEGEILEILKKHPIKEFVSLWDSASTLELMQKSELAIAKSGTCILELALLNTKTIVIYAISKLDIFIATKIFNIKLPYYSLPNLILNMMLFPELYGPNLTQKSLEQQIELSLFHKQDQSNDFKKLLTTLGGQDPGTIVANYIQIHL